MNNFLTIDLEYWWNNEFIPQELPDKKKELVEESIFPIIDVLAKYRVRCTFFVLGSLAEQYPDLINDIFREGHEIACHGYSHKRSQDLGKDGFEKELIKSLDILKKYQPIGYRAPYFSINNDTKWVFEILENYGFKYDSSLFPIMSRLYGVPNTPLYPYRPSKENITQHDPNGRILEFPLSAIKLGKNIPIAGGFYFRITPLWFTKWALKKINKQRPGILYFHPRDLFRELPRLDVSLLSNFVTYYGINNALMKFDNLLQSFKFQPLRELVNEF